MNWPTYLLRRVLQVIPLVFAIVVLTFLLINLAPGDPARVMAGERGNPEYLDFVRERYGLDEPLPTRLATYLGAVATGDLGRSLVYQRPVLDLILQRLGPTLLLIGAAQLIALIGVVVGVMAGAKRGTRGDFAISTVALGLYSTPVFWTALMAIMVFAVFLGWLPSSGMSNVAETHEGVFAALDIGRHLILPATVLALVWYAPEYFRVTRASVIDTLNEDFVPTARATGQPERTVLFRHVLRYAALPVITLAGLHIGLALSGAIITESVFGWPGLGRLAFESITSRDYPVLVGILLFTGLSVAVMSVLTDVLYAVVDPRVRYQ
jgi:peptide/nickel transport system permease protein